MDIIKEVMSLEIYFIMEALNLLKLIIVLQLLITT